MKRQHRWTGLALLGLLATLAAALPGSPRSARAQVVPGRPYPAGPSSPEPPLAPPPGTQPTPPAPTAPAPPVTPRPAPPVVQPGVPVRPAVPVPRAEAISPGITDPPTPTVSIRVRVPATVDAGQDLEYHIRVENCSHAPAHHVLVRDPLPASARFVRADPQPTTVEPELTWNLGTLEACACRDITLVLAPTGSGDVQNCARVQFEHGECVSTRVCRPCLRLRKSGPERAVIYDALTYQIALTNTGSTPITGVALTDTLPDGLEHSSHKPDLTWDVGTLAPGQCRHIEYQVVAMKTGRLCNKAVATAAGGLREESESCVVVSEAKLALAETGPAERPLGQAATYQITVTNPGDAPVRNVILTDPVPAGTAFVRASAGGRLDGKEVKWSVGTLPPGGTKVVEFSLRGQVAGRVTNRATATADRGLTAQAEATTEFTGASALLLEVVDKDDPVEIGADTSYIITVRNQGTLPATNVRVKATSPEQMAAIRATGPADNHKEGPTILYEPTTLPPGKEARYEVFVKALAAGDVRFRVELTADQLPGGAVHEEESTTVYADTGAPRAAQPSDATRQSREKK
jgi:uncharacterized repeat protein (TIGR01451 family)